MPSKFLQQFLQVYYNYLFAVNTREDINQWIVERIKGLKLYICFKYDLQNSNISLMFIN